MSFKVPTEKNTVAILGAGRLQQPFIREAKMLGLKVIALDQDNNAFARYDADEFKEIQISDPEKVIAALSPIAGRLAFACTVATDFSHIIGRVNDALHLPGLNTAQGIVLTHKGKMRDFCRKHGFVHPSYIYTAKKQDCETWAVQNPSPDGFVIKPVQNMGARGVMFLKTAEELAFAFEFASHHDKNGEVILEHYIPAREISVDALCFEGKVFLTGVADRLIEIKDRHFFIENGHTLPGNFSPAEYTNILTTLQGYADALTKLASKPYHGALKGDLRLTDKGAVCIGEIAGRLSGGFMSTHTYPAAHGRSLMTMFARLLLGDASVQLSKTEALQVQGVSIERSLYANPGEISGLPSPEEIEVIKQKFAAEGLSEIVCNYRNGDTIANLQNNIGKVFHTVIHAATLAEGENTFSRLRAELSFKVITPPYNARGMAKTAREHFNNDFCWVCKVCDGGYCASGVPGMGGRGDMNSFRDNFNALAEYKIAPSYTTVTDKVVTPDTAFSLFHRDDLTFAAPVFSAPITGSQTNMGGSITEYDYALETGAAMTALNLMPTFGDGAAADKYKTGLHAIEMLGRGIPVFKPRADQQELMRRIREAEKAGAIAWGMDIDGVSFKTMVLKSAETRHKSLNEIRELAAASKLPFIIKGVMSERDAATAIEAGAAAIAVSNHGGRVLDGMPGTARVLPALSAFIRRESPRTQILADGGVRSGADIFRMLALGADAVLIGRPIAIMAVGHGRAGVQSLLEYYLSELRQTMKVCGIARLADIRPHHIAKFI